MPDHFTRIHSIATALLILIASSAAHSQQEPENRADNSYLTVHAGLGGLGNDVEDFGRGGLDYRFREVSRWRLRPTIGAFTTGVDANYVYAGLRRDFELTGQWGVTLGLDIGSFHDGNNFRLGNELEFQTSAELSYTRANGWRLGVGASHISNASIGGENPGSNAVLIFASLPL